jgi:hypothetical protein
LDTKRKRIYEVAFLAACLVFCLFGITFIFWLVGWVVLASNLRMFGIRIAIFIAMMVLTLFYMKYFLAPTFAPSVKKIDLLMTGNIGQYIAMTFESILHNAKGILMAKSFTVVFLIAMAAFAYFFTRQRIALVSLSISVTLLIVLLAYYTVYPHFYLKQTAMLFPILILAVVAGFPNPKMHYVLIAVLIAVLPNRLKHTFKTIKDRREAYVSYNAYRELREAFEEIPAHIQPASTTILWAYNEYGYGRSAEALLPFSTRDKNPIMYTTNVVEPSEPAEKKFEIRGKLHLDYLLSRQELAWPFLEKVHATPFYHLYKINKETKTEGRAIE